MSQFENTIAHIYAQEYWHDDACISGNKESLVQIRDAIDKAIKNGQSSLSLFTNDGEGFELSVIRLTNDECLKIALPYTDEIAKPTGSGLFFPWSKIKDNP